MKPEDDITFKEKLVIELPFDPFQRAYLVPGYEVLVVDNRSGSIKRPEDIPHLFLFSTKVEILAVDIRVRSFFSVIEVMTKDNIKCEAKVQFEYVVFDPKKVIEDRDDPLRVFTNLILSKIRVNFISYPFEEIFRNTDKVVMDFNFYNLFRNRTKKH